jgi:hypothetical protein
MTSSSSTTATSRSRSTAKPLKPCATGTRHRRRRPSGGGTRGARRGLQVPLLQCRRRRGRDVRQWRALLRPLHRPPPAGTPGSRNLRNDRRHARCGDDRENVRIAMSEPKDLKLDTGVTIPGLEAPLHFVNTGVPHAVAFVPGGDFFENLDVYTLGKTIRDHAAFAPAGTNANFATVLRPTTSRSAPTSAASRTRRSPAAPAWSPARSSTTCSPVRRHPSRWMSRAATPWRLASRKPANHRSKTSPSPAPRILFSKAKSKSNPLPESAPD